MNQVSVTTGAGFRGLAILKSRYFVYLLKSSNHNQFYIGSTNDLEKRLRQHNEGKCTSTDRYKPWIIVYFEAYPTEKLARIREKQLKYHGNAKRELYKRLGFTPHHL